MLKKPKQRSKYRNDIENPMHTLVVVSTYISPSYNLTQDNLKAFTNLLRSLFPDDNIIIGGGLNPPKRERIINHWIEEEGMLTINDTTRPTRGDAVLDYLLYLPGSTLPPSLAHFFATIEEEEESIVAVHWLKIHCSVDEWTGMR